MHNDDDGDETARRASLAADLTLRTGIDEAMIATLVHTFYARIQQDQILGPIFASRIENWPRHLETMCSFWSSLVLRTGRYHGRPMPKHAPMPLDASHFDRWLALFEKTAADTCPAAAAELFIERARRIAESLELGIATFRGELLLKGQRLSPPAGVAMPDRT